MVLSISRKVDVKPGVIAPISTTNIQNCLLLSNEAQIFHHDVKEFSSVAEVVETFGANSKEANFATTYFGSYVGATKRPEKLLIGENYSLTATPSSITSSFFTDNTPQTQLATIGVAQSQPSVVITQTKNNEEALVQQLLTFGGDESFPSYISSLAIFKKEEDFLGSFRNIGEQSLGPGDFSIVFENSGNPVTVTATNIYLDEVESVSDALEVIEDAINNAINQSTLGEKFNVTLGFNGNDELGYLFSVSSSNDGSKYTIDRIFSTVPNSAANATIADIMELADKYEPLKVAGADKKYGDISITFEIYEQPITVTANQLNFLMELTLLDQLDYLEEQINEAITAEEQLGENFKITIAQREITEPGAPENSFFIEIQTINDGSNYNITNISSSNEGNVAGILGLTQATGAAFYPGADKRYGDFSVTFNVNNENITATANQLDFTGQTTLENQLTYLTGQINNAISANEQLGAIYSVSIDKNVLQDDMYNISISAVNAGTSVNLVSVSSHIPLESYKVANVLGLSADSNPAPTIINGSNAVPLAEVLDKYSNDRSDWWTISITESDMLTYNEIASWVNAKNDGCRYVFIAHDNNPLAKNTSANSSTFGYQIYMSGSKATTVIFGDETQAGFVAGVASSIDYERDDGVITFSGRRQNGLATTVNTDQEANCLESNYYNYYGSYSTINPKYRFYETGVVSGADGQNWLDSLFNQIWLSNQLQMAIFNLLLDKTKIPFNNSGYALISNACDAVAIKAIANGIITPGVTLDTVQINAVNEAVGKDVYNNLYSFGYYLFIGDNTSSDRLKRIARNCLLYYCDGGSIQTVKFVANVLL